MAKLVMDAFCRDHDRRDPFERAIVEGLRRPSVNHSGVRLPLIERYIIGDEAKELIEAEGRNWERCEVRPLHDIYWIEIGDFGFFVHDRFLNFVLRQGNSRARLVLQFDPFSFGDGFDVRPLTDDVPDESIIRDAMVAGYAAHVLIQTPRMSVVERILPPNGQSIAFGAASRRLAQRGKIRPSMFSYNKVTQIAGDTSRIAGVIRGASEAGQARREHEVRGHWRLYDKVSEPYFRWIDAHKSGNPELGTIVKERHVRLPQEVRRGFRVPTHVGVEAERVRAERVH